MAVGGWARLLASNQTQNGLSQANMSQLNQTTEVCHFSRAVAGLEPGNQTRPG
jgi:hypothetical protein